MQAAKQARDRNVPKRHPVRERAIGKAQTAELPAVEDFETSDGLEPANKPAELPGNSRFARLACDGAERDTLGQPDYIAAAGVIKDIEPMDLPSEGGAP
ncbi:hypothetical protein [Paenibacillus sp. UNC496MF]|uniref:hypothetical protein n=1 Tax=Paenibacillus sp. UNC496MF TaxID=1502753 RepID=UPI000B827F1A|nr:hypothetical protein [Paenibacillus sp. UNC496MF]